MSTLFHQQLCLFASTRRTYVASRRISSCRSGPSNVLYYFECCSGECCLRLQLIPSFIIAAIAIFLTCVCCTACCCYCCCRD
ncbi:unnamed protein product [Heligmosomoides polygyrus]|uniref:Uncharacterized protein n=1 Tax=Heligmosomoides polygyrus TaxID=6339 RepID=A0A3P7TVA7_HELPZ|nr:unnamed protein product [Heligmosomoides polygyrus]